jgi:hypothetical protein
MGGLLASLLVPHLILINLPAYVLTCIFEFVHTCAVGLFLALSVCEILLSLPSAVRRLCRHNGPYRFAFVPACLPMCFSFFYPTS